MLCLSQSLMRFRGRDVINRDQVRWFRSSFPSHWTSCSILVQSRKEPVLQKTNKNLTLHCKTSLNNLDLSTILVQTNFLLIFFFDLFLYVILINNFTPCADKNQPSAKNNPSSFFGKRKQISPFLFYPRDEHTSPQSSNVTSGLGMYIEAAFDGLSQIILGRSAGTTMQAAFFGNFLKITS